MLLLALDDYFSSPSQDCLARLFDAINSTDLSAAPILTRSKKRIMRNSERKDVFIEKFTSPRASSEPPQHLKRKRNHGPMNSTGSHSGFDEDIMIRTKDGEQGRDRAGSDTSTRLPSAVNFRRTLTRYRSLFSSMQALVGTIMYISLPCSSR